VSHESGRRRQSLQSIVPCDLGMYATLVTTVEARSSGQAHNLPPPTGTLLKPVDIGVFPNAAFTGRSWNQARHDPRISRHCLKQEAVTTPSVTSSYSGGGSASGYLQMF
jgi:hypothetical protein